MNLFVVEFIMSIKGIYEERSCISFTENVWNIIAVAQDKTLAIQKQFILLSLLFYCGIDRRQDHRLILNAMILSFVTHCVLYQNNTSF